MKKNLFSRIKTHFKKRKFFESAFLMITLIIIYTALYYFAQSIEPNLYDMMIKTYTQVTAKDKSAADDRILMVLIDNESIDKIGRWPWPRKKYIELFDYLVNVGHAKVIAFDSVIKGSDVWNPESDTYFFENLNNFNNIKIGLDFQESPQKHFGVEVTSFLDKNKLSNVTDNRTNKKDIGVYDIFVKPFLKILESH
ncbi:MAG: CHASE2 domain-containing protein, partial [Vampirovibrionia bacterium]